LGGAAITLGFLGSYNDGLTNGRGYVALAVVIIGRWSPLGALAGAFLFAFFDSLSLRIQDDISMLPNEAFSMLPYLMTLLVLVATARSKIAPRELGK
ncbi:ABC transporter permease subunit, partial [Shinella sp.]|uniref:ABC transporter permease subunit n=1 Tax=Shinella sp. TaxID=1870904 RepID=UPI0039E356EA